MLERPSQFATVAKRFRWDSAHRLPRHDGACKNLHGHSYSMIVELEGPIGGTGIVIDFKVIKDLVKPLVDAWDHATLVADYDTDLLRAVRTLDSKYAILPSDSTAENLAVLVANHVLEQGRELLQTHGITQLCIRIHETETCWAEVSRVVNQ